MPNDNLLEIVEPWLRELQDDPERPLPANLERTSFPLGGEDLVGEVIEVGTESDGSILADKTPAKEDIAAAREAHRESGVDVLAFYKSFRFCNRPPVRGKWGIFLIGAGISAVEAEYAALAPRVPRLELQKLAVDTLVAHERYHFWIDVWAAGQETLPISRRVKRYEHYLANRRDVVLTRFDYEESLANHYAYRHLRSRKLSDGTRAGRLVKNLFLESPEPYSNFIIEPDIRAEKEGALAGAVTNGLNTPCILFDTRFSGRSASILGPSIRPVYARHPAVGHDQCPVYVLTITDYAARVQPFRGPSLKEFRQFIERFLAGQKEATTDHDYYRIDNGERVKFPNPHDKDVRGYEMKGTLLKAGMTLSDFRHERLATKNWTRNCPRGDPKPPLTG